jgi:hypothetical protein
MELALRFIISNPTTDYSESDKFTPDLVDIWLHDQAYEEAIHELFLDHARDIITKELSNDVPIRALEAYRCKED